MTFPFIFFACFMAILKVSLVKNPFKNAYFFSSEKIMRAISFLSAFKNSLPLIADGNSLRRVLSVLRFL